MLKYVDTKVTFAEIPEEISLCINISNCPCHCKGCHSPYLAEDVGIILNENNLMKLINQNLGITCICFMGGDSNPQEVNALARYLKFFNIYKVAWYSGKPKISSEINLENFDYIKLGPYKESLGGLDSKDTNQVLLKIENITNKVIKSVQ